MSADLGEEGRTYHVLKTLPRRPLERPEVETIDGTSNLVNVDVGTEVFVDGDLVTAILVEDLPGGILYAVGYDTYPRGWRLLDAWYVSEISAKVVDEVLDRHIGVAP